MSDRTDNTKPGDRPRTAPEWISLILSLLLLAALVGLITALWVQDRRRPPTFRIEKGAVRKAGVRYYLPVTVRNDGDATAANVMVEGKLDRRAATSEGDVPSATTTFDFVPAHASAEAVLIFTAEPSAADVQVTSFQPP